VLALRICGVDEAGRGPLAGPVYAAAVVLDPGRKIRGLKDSKLLTAEVREELSVKIRERAIAFAVAQASVHEIDSLNILRAALLAMRRAVEALGRIGPDALPLLREVEAGADPLLRRDAEHQLDLLQGGGQDARA